MTNETKRSVKKSKKIDTIVPSHKNIRKPKAVKEEMTKKTIVTTLGVKKPQLKTLANTKIDSGKIKIAISSDHSGVALKKAIVTHLKASNIEVEDFGSFSGTAPDDYPDFVTPVANKVLSDCDVRGIVICGTGVGISIAANKIDGIYCALCNSPEIAFFARTHNDCNCLALGARYTARNIALKIVEVFVSTEYEGGRHERRIQKIREIEANN